MRGATIDSISFTSDSGIGGLSQADPPQRVLIWHPVHTSCFPFGGYVSGSDQTDEDLIARLRAREPHAWAEIYERFSSQLYSFFLNQSRNRELAEDLTASVFVDGLNSAATFTGDLAGLRAWLFRIGRNNLIDHFRKERRVVMQDISTTDPAELSRSGMIENPEAEAIAGAEKAMALKSIEELAPDQREVMLLRLVGGLTSAEVAEIIGKTVGAVKQLQHRALLVLSKRLGG